MNKIRRALTLRESELARFFSAAWRMDLEK
jgi:hypothetical protein